MSRLIRLVKNKVATGAVIGALLGGATPTIIQSYSLPENASITTPLTLDDINAYGVTIQKFNIQKLSNDDFKIITEEQVKEYRDIKDIITSNNHHTIETNNIDLVISSPWTLNEDLSISRTKYHYSNKNANITTEEVSKLIEMFKLGEIEQILNNPNIDLAYDHEEYAKSNEITENYNYSSELTIKTIDYNDIQVIKQDKNENIVETSIAGVTALIGFRLGIYAGNICENSTSFIKKKVKEKKINN